MSELEHGQADLQQRLGELLEEVIDQMGLDATVSTEVVDEQIIGVVSGEDLGLFIGRRGQTIDAVQHLAQRTLFHGSRPTSRVVVDADGYRERRAAALRELADETADDALDSGEAIELDPMPSSERRIVHEHLRDRGDVETHSEGDEPERFLVVSPKNP